MIPKKKIKKCAGHEQPSNHNTKLYKAHKKISNISPQETSEMALHTNFFG